MTKTPIDRIAESTARGIIAAPDGSEWQAIRRGDGIITGYIEVFRDGAGRFATVPGASRFINGAAFDLALATRGDE
jgi:hypothetical protein